MPAKHVVVRLKGEMGAFALALRFQDGDAPAVFVPQADIVERSFDAQSKEHVLTVTKAAADRLRLSPKKTTRRTRAR